VLLRLSSEIKSRKFEMAWRW